MLAVRAAPIETPGYQEYEFKSLIVDYEPLSRNGSKSL
jgi:hypothetical protein